MTSHDSILKKYNSIRKRAFKSYIEVRLFHFFQQAIVNPCTNDIVELIVLPELYDQYAACCQLTSGEEVPGHEPLTIGELDKLYTNWYNNYTPELRSLQQYFENNCFLSIEKFAEVYNKIEEKCHYCNITEDKIELLRSQKKIKTKRFITRGKTLEVDRINPFQPYEEGNLVLCCYWCNNAKTDEFSEEEFIKVGKVMEQIWEERLKSNPDPKDRVTA